MNYTLHIPTNYIPPPLPGRDEWTADLRANPDKQCTGRLGTPEGPNCCLGRLSLLQGRLTKEGWDKTVRQEKALSHENPLYEELNSSGFLPARVYVVIDCITERNAKHSLAECNDAGLSFAQIADIIETVWSDGGPLLK